MLALSHQHHSKAWHHAHGSSTSPFPNNLPECTNVGIIHPSFPFTLKRGFWGGVGCCAVFFVGWRHILFEGQLLFDRMALLLFLWL